MVTLTEFQNMVAHYDMTHDYESEYVKWSKGHEQKKRILAVAPSLPIDEVRRIWNARVDQCVSEAYRKHFYWKG